MSTAFVFPGQGSQSIGMLAALASQYDDVQKVFASASQRLGYDLWALTQDGPQERLNSTECTQPAMLAAGVATWRIWQRRGGPLPDLVAGHSLGEFTALAVAGALDPDDAIELVRFRGQVMQEAVPRGEGGMAAIIGLDDAEVEAACAEAAQGEVVDLRPYLDRARQILQREVDLSREDSAEVSEESVEMIAQGLYSAEMGCLPSRSFEAVE